MNETLFRPPAPPVHFIGRDRELRWLERELSYRESGRPEPILIVGPAGMGKTALINSYIRNPTERERRREFRLWGTEFAWIECRDFEQRREPFDSFIRNDAAHERMAVVLDGAHEISPSELSAAMRFLVNYKRVNAVIITKRDEDLGDRDEWFTERVKTLNVGPLTFQAAESFLAQLGSFDEQKRFRLLDAARGHPLTMTLLAKLAAQLGSDEFRRIIGGDIYGLSDFGAVAEPELVKIIQPIIVSASAAMVEALKKEPDGVHRLSPRQFEELVAELMRDMGWDVELTPATRDGGKDILAYLPTEIGRLLCLVEAKRYRSDRKIGVELVRSLYGTLIDHHANSAMLVTTSSFARDAREFQKKYELQLRLKDYTDVVSWIMKHGRGGGTVQ